MKEEGPLVFKDEHGHHKAKQRLGVLTSHYLTKACTVWAQRVGEDAMTTTGWGEVV